MVDTVLKIIALASFAGFIAFLPIYVRDLDLLAVCVIVVAMAAYDFFLRPLWRSRRLR